MKAVVKQFVKIFALSLVFQVGSALARVTADETLCFPPGSDQVDTEGAIALARLQANAAQLGRLEGISFTTLVATPPLETDQVIESRERALLSELRRLGVQHNLVSQDKLIPEDLAAWGCRTGLVPVQVTLLYAEPSSASVHPHR